MVSRLDLEWACKQACVEFSDTFLTEPEQAFKLIFKKHPFFATAAGSDKIPELDRWITKVHSLSPSKKVDP